MPSQPLFGIPVMVGMSLAVMAMRKVRSACEGKGAAMIKVVASSRPNMGFFPKRSGVHGLAIPVPGTRA